MKWWVNANFVEWRSWSIFKVLSWNVPGDCVKLRKPRVHTAKTEKQNMQLHTFIFWKRLLHPSRHFCTNNNITWTW